MRFSRYFAIVVCFFITQIALAANDNKHYAVDIQTKTVKVSGDCEIPVSELSDLFPTPDIYGIKGGANFQSKMEDLNRRAVSSGGVCFMNSNGTASIKINVSKFESISLSFYGATLKERKGWCPNNDSVYSIKFDKGTNGKSMLNLDNSTLTDRGIINQLRSDIDSLKTEMSGLNGNQDGIVSSPKEAKVLWIILFLSLLSLLLLICVLNKTAKHRYNELAKGLDDVWKNIGYLQAQDVRVVDNPSKNKGATLSNDEIRRYIVEQIKSLQPKPTGQPSSPVNQKRPDHEKKEQNTDEVKFHSGGVPFFTIEPTDLRIFRIYSKGGEYFYTIVDDAGIREEIVGMLQSLDDFIAYQTTENVAKRVEPVTPGRLRKEGDKYFVDANHKLLVKFV